MDNKIYLCSFASDDLDLSVQRFKKQADNLNIYSQIKIFRPKDLNLNLQNQQTFFSIFCVTQNS